MEGLEGQCQREGSPFFLFNSFLGEDIAGQRVERATPWVRKISFNVSLQNSPHSPLHLELPPHQTAIMPGTQQCWLGTAPVHLLVPLSYQQIPWWNRVEHKESGQSRHTRSRSISVWGRWQLLYMTNESKKDYPRDAVFGEIKLQIY